MRERGQQSAGLAWGVQRFQVCTPLPGPPSPSSPGGGPQGFTEALLLALANFGPRCSAWPGRPGKRAKGRIQHLPQSQREPTGKLQGKARSVTPATSWPGTRGVRDTHIHSFTCHPASVGPQVGHGHSQNTLGSGKSGLRNALPPPGKADLVTNKSCAKLLVMIKAYHSFFFKVFIHLF